jgi:hypothetical protein
MKSLSNYINEAVDNTTEVKEEIKEFLKKTYGVKSGYKISRKPDTDGKYIVEDGKYSAGWSLKDKSIKQLTNGLFKFGFVYGFDCSGGKQLESLEGGPTECQGLFMCTDCISLKDLKGAPQSGQSLTICCRNCTSLESFEGIAEELFSLDAEGCNEIKTIKHFPKKIYELVLPWCINKEAVEKRCKFKECRQELLPGYDDEYKQIYK